MSMSTAFALRHRERPALTGDHQKHFFATIRNSPTRDHVVLKA